MEITRTKDVNVVKYIKTVVGKFIESEKIESFDATKFLQYLRRAIVTPNYMVWVASEEDNVNGVLVASVQNSLKGDYLMISCFFGETNEVSVALIDKVVEWMNENSLGELIMMTKFPKKLISLGFKVHEHLLVKEI